MERETIFHTRCTSYGNVCLVIIDSGSCTNAVSEEMVTKLGLKTERHPKPYNIHWLQDGVGMKFTKCCLVSFSIGKTYNDEIWCDIMKMNTCHLLLGRPWMYDRRVKHDGYLNTYSFMKDRHKVTLRPMHLEELAKRPKPVQVGFMMRTGVVSRINKGKHALIVVSKKKPNEEDYVPLDPRVELPEEYEVSLIFNVADLAPFVDPLDSRTSLSQPGENDANVGDQAQAHLLMRKWRVISAKMRALDVFISALWTCLKIQIQEGQSCQSLE